MERSIVFAGFGGQGLLFAGHVLAQAAMAEGLEVLWIPSYGPEMRGGTASCTVIVGDEPIGSPVVDRADAAVVMNPPSLAKFAPLGRPGRPARRQRRRSSRRRVGPDRPRGAAPPLHRAGRDAGDDKLVSVVALGALVGPPAR